MLGALLYLQATSLRNRLLVRLRRLRQPRYLFGALLGGAYFAWIFSRVFLGAEQRAFATRNLPALPDVWELLAAAILLLVLLGAWLLPNKRAALVFSEAEIAFLFPAPIRRVTLIHYKLLKSQLGILFTVAFLAVISPRGGGFDAALMRAAGWWFLLSTVQLHTLGASFTRTILLERGVTHWQRRLLVALVVGGFLAAAIHWAGDTLPAPQAEDFQTTQAAQAYAHRFAASPPATWLLGPLRLMVRPFLAPDGRSFALAAGPALLILLLHYLWVVRSDVAFEEASLESSQRQARVAEQAARSGDLPRRSVAWRKRRAPFRLGPTGTPAVAILWKNLLAAGQIFNTRLFFSLLFTSAFVGLAMSGNAGGTAWPQFVSFFAQMLLFWSVFVGPQFVRCDFRQDLGAADVLKSYPIKGWQMALGQLLAPTAILSGVQWLLLALIGGLDAAGPRADEGSALSYPLAAAILVPFFNGTGLLIPNAAVLLLPGWFGTSGRVGAGRGIEVLGQRLIFVLGQLVVLALTLAPAALVFFAAKVLIADTFLPNAWVLPFSAACAASVLAMEFVFGLLALGHWFETLDLSTERIS